MDHINLLRQLVALQTVNDPAKELRPTRECPRLIEGKLRHLGMEVEILEQNGFYSVMGTYGQGHPVTLFLAHFDVVPSGPNWVTDPFKLTIQNGMGYGRGTADDKGNIVALLLTAKAITEQPIGGTIVCAMTGDEEIGGANGATAVRHRLEQQNLFPDYLVTADGVGMQIVTRRRNTCGFTIRVPKQSKTVQGTIEQSNFTTVYFGREGRHSAYFLPGVDRHPAAEPSHVALEQCPARRGEVSLAAPGLG